MSNLDGELTDVRTVRDCEEMATVDACDEGEVADGWLNCINDAFSLPQVVEVFGEEVDLVGFNQQYIYTILGICRRKREKVNIGLDSINLRMHQKQKSFGLKPILAIIKNW